MIILDNCVRDGINLCGYCKASLPVGPIECSHSVIHCIELYPGGFVPYPAYARGSTDMVASGTDVQPDDPYEESGIGDIDAAVRFGEVFLY